MEIRVRFFAILRERTGLEATALRLEPPATVGEAWRRLEEEFPALLPFRDCVTFAVNREYVSPAHQLAAGDELALIPPVSGGSGRGSHR